MKLEEFLDRIRDTTEPISRTKNRGIGGKVEVRPGSDNLLSWKSHDEIRELLSQLRPLQIITLFYSRYYSNQLPPPLLQIRQEYSQRSHLLKWVFQDERIYQDLTYVRLPSESKRVLVSNLVSRCRKRFPWINSKLIHAMAFRPEYFDFRKKDHSDKCSPGLYRKKSIAKGEGGRRVLYIPNPPLRRIQRNILSLCLNPALSDLPEYVIGCRPGSEFTIFDNAAFHIGQKFVVNLDLKNFFDSVRTQHVMRALSRIECRLLEHATIAPAGNGAKVAKREFPWTHDTMVLISRLCTLRGRLPQGAPTSPALANLAFAEYDEKIRSALGPDFVYTRYVDDLTISLSKAAARRLGKSDKRDLSQTVKKTIEIALASSGFELNRKKLRVSTDREGHSVTGLRVESALVKLPRKRKRSIRELIHKLEHRDFLEIAKDQLGSEIVVATRLDMQKHEHIGARRRISTEKLAVLMLKQLCDEIEVTIPVPPWTHPEVKPSAHPTVERGKNAWRIIEKLLTYLWRHEVCVELHEETCQVFNSKGERVCSIRSASGLAFFFLSKREAIISTEFWHKLRGIKSSLKVVNRDDCFNLITQLHDALEQALRNITLRIPKTPVEYVVQPAASVSGEVTLTPESEANELALQVIEKITEYWQVVTNNLDIPDRWPSNATKFRRPISTSQQLKDWIAITWALLDELGELPLRGHEHGVMDDTFELLFVWRHRMNGELPEPYRVEHGFAESVDSGFRTFEEITDKASLKAQRLVLQKLNFVFTASLSTVVPSNVDAWKKMQTENGFSKPMVERLKKANEKFLGLHSTAIWPSTEQRLFKTSANKPLKDVAPEIERAIRTNSGNQKVWEHLFAICKELVKGTTESLNKLDDDEEPDKLIKLFKHYAKSEKKIVELAWLMRNRDTHVFIPEKHYEWVRIQSWIARLLGKSWEKQIRQASKKEKRMFVEGDLNLTPFEGNLVKLKIVEGMSKILERCQINSRTYDSA